MPGENKRLSQAEGLAWQTVIRNLIKHENELVNQRLSWLVQIQGLFFAALAFAWERAPRELTFLLAILGIATAVSLWTALGLYSPAVRGLRAWWQEHRPEGSIEGPDVIGLWRPSQKLGRLLRPWRALPCIFIAAWIGVIVVAWLE